MELNTDFAFRMGKDHTVCEDYAFSYEKENISIAVVSDGCSGSPLTDIGARILTHTFLKEGDYRLNKENLISESRVIASKLCIPETALDATLIYCWSDLNTGKTGFSMYGDGTVMVGTRKNGVLKFDSEYSSGYPYYLNYFKSPRLLEYSKINQKVVIKETQVNEWVDFFEISNSFEPDFIFSKEFDIEDIEWIVCFSDGISSVNSDKAAYDFCTFKNMNGNFLQRRFKRWEKINKKDGLFHYDDVSVAGIHFKEEDNETI